VEDLRSFKDVTAAAEPFGLRFPLSVANRRSTLVPIQVPSLVTPVSNKVPADRLSRLENALSVLVSLEKFTLAELKAKLSNQKSFFVTRLVRELEREGHLRKGEGEIYSWATAAPNFSAKTWLEKKVYAPQLPQTPAADRPRERLLANGAAALRTAELLAILIRSGRTGESALQAGEKIAARYGAQLDRLPEAGRGDLKGLAAAVGETAYCQIMAGIELGRRVAQAQNERPQQPCRLVSSADAVQFCRERFARLASDGAQEEFHVVCLDTMHQVLSSHRTSVGTLDRSLIHPREVFRPAIKDAAKAILLVHNHPSGDPTPSTDDLTLTARLEEAGKTVGIQVLDHVVVARNGAISIRDHRSSI
jgi:DNA repair protein RadC